MIKHRFLFVLVFGLLFAGCSVAVPIYIQNETADAVLVEVHLQKPLDRVYKIPILLNTTDVLKARKLFKKEKSDSLLISGKDSVWRFSIPPKSILLLETGMNFGSYRFRSVKVGERELLKFVTEDHNPFYSKEVSGLQVLRKGKGFEFLYKIKN